MLISISRNARDVGLVSGSGAAGPTSEDFTEGLPGSEQSAETSDAPPVQQDLKKMEDKLADFCAVPRTCSTGFLCVCSTEHNQAAIEKILSDVSAAKTTDLVQPLPSSLKGRVATARSLLPRFITRSPLRPSLCYGGSDGLLNGLVRTTSPRIGKSRLELSFFKLHDVSGFVLHDAEIMGTKGLFHGSTPPTVLGKDLKLCPFTGSSPRRQSRPEREGPLS